MTRIEQAVRQSLGEIIPEELGVDLVSAGTVTEIEEQEGLQRGGAGQIRQQADHRCRRSKASLTVCATATPSRSVRP